MADGDPSLKGYEKCESRIRERYHLPHEVDIPGAATRLARQGLSRVFLSSDHDRQLSMLRSDDKVILRGVRREVLSILNRMDWDHDGKGGSANRVFLKSDLSQVIKEVLWGGPEESYCFLNEGKLRERMGLLRSNFIPEIPWRRISYAMKANPKNRILQILLEEGLDGFDCASLNEVKVAQGQNVRAEVFFNNPVKSVDHIAEAYRSGVRYFTVQDRQEIQKVLRVGKPWDRGGPVELAVRLSTPNEEAEINLSEKYGADPSESLRLLKLMGKMVSVNRGIAIHTGSQNSNSDTFRKGIGLMAEVARKAGGVETANLGGGIPVNYHPDEHYEILQYLEAINSAVRMHLNDIFSNRDTEKKVILELGRALVADSVDLAIPILSAGVRGGEKCLYINDGVFTSFSDAVVHRWQYRFDAIRKKGKSSPQGREPYRLFGRTCDSGDTLGVVDLPSGLRTGDYLWVKNAGAYLDSQSTRFNGFDPPAYISYNV